MSKPPMMGVPRNELSSSQPPRESLSDSSSHQLTTRAPPEPKQPTPPLTILLADDEPSIRLSVSDALAAAGHRVIVVEDGALALEQLARSEIELVITDIRMPRASGLEVFHAVLEHYPTVEVILMTAYGKIPDAVAALKAGASDYLTKPFDMDELMVRVGRIAARRAVEAELRAARQEGANSRLIVGQSLGMRRLRERVTTLADSNANVLILGESGTGKELVARSLHEQSPRRDRPLVVVNCGAFPDALLEAELFGHERGAFTGASRQRGGRFKLADGGTLFLDEIAEMSPPAQAKLLRVLQDGSFEPLGSSATVHVDVRVISATHRDLKRRIATGEFREDLYYRLRVLDVAIPPLRERPGDLPLLIEHFLGRHGQPGGTFSARAWAAIMAYPFPGNVRELEHLVEHGVVLARGAEIQLSHLPQDVQAVFGDDEGGEPVRVLAQALREFERQYLLRALAVTSGRRARAAELLGISRKNLWEKLRAHGISDSELEE